MASSNFARSHCWGGARAKALNFSALADALVAGLCVGMGLKALFGRALGVFGGGGNGNPAYGGFSGFAEVVFRKPYGSKSL